MHSGERADGVLLARRYRVRPGEPVREGRGEVLHADDDRLGRRVVLKRSDSGEARAYAKFAHAHIVTVHDIVTVDAEPYAGTWLVMEHAPHGSLAGRTMPPAEAAAIGAQIADALRELHRAGLVHCDVKPANIVIAANGAAKLTDFDAAHRLDGAETISPERRIAYTPDYAAPEVIDGNPQPASDVFSLAATVHALVTGHPPRPWAYDAEDEDADADADTDRMRNWEAGRGITQLAPDAELGPLGPVLTAMLRPNPAERPDAAAAYASLKAVVSPRRGFPPRGVRLAGVAALAAAAVVVGAIVLWPDERPPGDQEQPQAQSVLGSLQWADPCALFDLTELSRFEEDADLDRAYGQFNRCDVIVGADGETPVDVMIQFDDDSFGQGNEPVRFVGGIGIVELEGDMDDCSRGLTLPGPDQGTRVFIEAGYEDNDDVAGPMPLCDMADSAARTAATTLEEARAAGTTIPQRSFPGNSLAHLDACTLLDGDALAAAIPAVDVNEPEIGYANWYCRWGSTSGDMEAILRFDQGNELDGDDGRTTRIGGREAFVTPGYEGPGSCTVRVEHRSFTGQGRADKTEVLHLSVLDENEPTERLCALATDLATAATPHLPPA